MEKEHFGRAEGNSEDMLLACDLLVLDDLGAEFASPFYVSCLYNLINTRMLEGRTIILSTNLNQNQLKERYGDPRLPPESPAPSYRCFLWGGISGSRSGRRSCRGAIDYKPVGFLDRRAGNEYNAVWKPTAGARAARVNPWGVWPVADAGLHNGWA